MAFGKAVTNGPLVLAIHALFGTIIVFSGIATVIRTFMLHQKLPTIPSLIAMLAILVAWLSGSWFVGEQSNGASISMAVASLIATLCFATILYLVLRTTWQE